MKHRSRQRGFALLVVLSTAALLALIGTRLTATGRTEMQIARNITAAAVAEAAADGGVAEAIYHLLAPPAQAWQPDGRPYRVGLGTAALEIRITSETGKLNPNTAPLALLAGLFRRIGLQPPEAERLAGAVFDWHTPGSLSSTGGDKVAAYRAAGRTDGPTGRPFEILDEMQAVLGMTPAILAALRPALSVYNAAGIDVRYAPPALRAALAELTMGFDTPPARAIAVTIDIRAEVPGGRATRRAVVQLTETDPSRPYRVLTWESIDG